MKKIFLSTWMLVLAVFWLFSGGNTLLFAAEKMMDKGAAAQEEMKTEGVMKKETGMMKEEGTMKSESGTMKQEEPMKKESGVMKKEETMKKEGGMMKETK
jgi:hypothetical protein